MITELRASRLFLFLGRFLANINGTKCVDLAHNLQIQTVDCLP
jgi:hypothetical protein